MHRQDPGDRADRGRRSGLGYEGITYTKREKVLEVGPITATKETKKTIPLPPILGGAGLVCGVVLLITAGRP